ncbi:MAG: efflux RND transporter periplasmic adaptor subunit [Candidatus Eisenbacteria bacterium]|nr:efflux RND transporter periplasmic adaptor subunit [Candidatus Eisenbacteria bacterium]
MGRALLVAAAAALLLAGCGRPGQAEGERGTEAIPVEVVRIATETVSATVTATGTLRAVDDVPVAAEASGRVIEVPVGVGDRVEEGDVLVRLDSELASLGLRQANSQWVLARTELEDATDAFERARVLWDSKDISEVEFEAAERRLEIARASYDGALAAVGTAQRQLDNASVAAPVGGWVAFVYAEEGHLVAAGTPVAHVINDSTMKLDLGLGEDQITGVRMGDPVAVRVRALPGKTFRGRVEYVGRRSEDVNRTYPIRVRLENGSRELRSGMVAEAIVTTGRFPDALVVERDWVVQRFGEPAVFVAADSLAVVRRVTLGKAVGDRVVVTSGLSEGDLLITAGLDLLSDQAEIELKNGPGHPPVPEGEGR